MTKRAGASLAKNATSPKRERKPIGKTEAPKRLVTEVNPDSFISQIASLEIGQVASKAERIAGDEANWSTIQAASLGMRNSTTGQIRHAKNRTGGEFTMASGDFRASNGDVMVIVTVTRTG